MSDRTLGPTEAAPPAPAAEQRGSLWLLLASLVLLQFGYPVTYHGAAWTVAYLLVYGGVIAYGVRTVRPNPRRNWPIGAASVTLIVAGTWFAVHQADATATMAMLAAVGLLQVSLVLTLGATLFDPPRDTQVVDLLLVAVCAYLLLGGIFGVAAGIIEIAQPGSYVDAAPGAGAPTWQTLQYGSHVTLSTLGFGDVTPVRPWPRALWSFEAIVGTLYLTVVIARLVGAAGVARRHRG